MLIRPRRDWDLPEREATPRVLFDRRGFLAAGAAALATPALAQRVGDDPSVALYPAKDNPAFAALKPTPAELVTRYNNFIELGPGKATWRRADDLKIRPWRVAVEGLVERPQEFEIDDLLRAFPLEQRVYRLRCVETWAAVVPWTGFPLADLIKRVAPKSDAKFVRFETFLDPEMGRGQRAKIYPWPYVEALTMAEAAHDLAFVATGAYGAPLAKQMGAPLRLVVPWKYGFKSIKSLRRISFVAERPKTLWEKLQPDEYGFWANVNPKVAHKRWSQAEENLLGSEERIPTRLFNGYAEQVAALYAGMGGDELYR
jgi:sulfoxide reductase catalytic subunit YedY